MKLSFTPALLLALVTPGIAHAQEPPAAEDDMELPAEPAAAPEAASATSQGPVPTNGSTAPSTGLVPPAGPPADAAVPTTPVVPAPVSRAASADASPPQSNAVVGDVEAEKALNLSSEPDAQDGLRVGGYLQAEFQANALSEDEVLQGGELANSDRFLVRRARLRLDRVWEFASGTIELDANTVRGVSLAIRRAEASVFYRGGAPNGAPPLVALTAGATDLPFGFELQESTAKRFFMERTLGSAALFPTEADVGVKVSGGASFLRYALALTNGEPLSASGWPRDPNAAKDLTGRIGVDVADPNAFSIAGGTSFAVGNGFHRGQAATKDSVVWVDDDGNGQVSLPELLGVPGSAGSSSENFDRWVLGLDLGVAFFTPLGRTHVYGEAFVGENHDRGFAEADPVAQGADIRHAGAYAALVQQVTPWGVVGVRASFYDPNSDVLESRKGKIVPKEQSVTTISPLVGVVVEGRGRLLLQYDFVQDHLARDGRGVPTDAKNDQLTARLQVEL